MNLRFCAALFVSTLLSGCVLTDETNLTGGEFLAAHGAKAGDTTSRTLALPVQSIEVLPMAGVPGANGTEDVAFGSLDGDSLRLVVGFDLSDKSKWDERYLKQQDTLTRLRLIAKDSFPGATVRARFVFLNDSCLPGLFAGLEPARLPITGAVVDTELTLQRASVGTATFVALPGTVIKQVAGRMVDSTAIKSRTNGWLALIIDTRPKNGGFKARFHDTLRLVGPAVLDTSKRDSSGAVGPGTFEGNAAWMTIGFRQAGSPLAFGWWPSGGTRLRMHINTSKLRTSMYQAFSVTNPDTAGGFDNSFNILQARATVGLSKVSTETNPGFVSMTSSVVVWDTMTNDQQAPRQTLSVKPWELPLSAETRRLCGLKSNPLIGLTYHPAMFRMQLHIDGDSVPLPTRLSLALGSTSKFQRYGWYIPVGDSVEFTIYDILRVRIITGKDKITAKAWRLEVSPVAENQFRRANDSLRYDAYLWSGSTKLVHEIRRPFAQAVNRNKPVEFELVPFASKIYSNSMLAIPADPAKVFESVSVVARPLVGRNY